MPPSIGDTLATFSLSAVRIVLYPLHFVLRILGRLALLVATVMPVAFPFLAGAALVVVWQEEDMGTKIASWAEEDHALVTGLAYFVTVGLFSSFLKTIINIFWIAVRGLIEPIRDVFRGGWIPSADVRESLSVTWRDNIGKIPRNLALTARRAAQVTAAVVVGTFVVGVTIPFVLRDPEVVDRYVWVVNADAEAGTKPLTPGAGPPAEAEPPEIDPPPVEAEPPGANTPHKPSTTLKAHLQNGTVFSLTHLKDAQPQTGDGICLNELQQAWLREFRNAIADCVEAESANGSALEVPRFEVRAFASVAPVKSSGVSSADLNCDVANRRADAVGAFLADETLYKSKWDCDGVKVDFNAATSHCARSASDDPFEDYRGVHRGAKFKVHVRKWRNPSEMEGRKPADDGALPDVRRYGAEMFNRSVHITVPRGFCRPSQSERPEGQSSTGDTTDAKVPAEGTNVRE